MVLDRSGSMEEEVLYQGKMRKKIEIVKEVFESFVAGGGGLPGRKTDLIGLTTFARFTEENCPLVTTYEPLLSTVKNLTTVAPFLDQYDQTTWNQSVAAKENPLNATAIGDGLKRAILSLVTAEDDLSRGEKGGGYKIQGKVIILLTDGKNNAGSDPTEAGRYAKENGIRIYYVLLRELVERRQTLFGTAVVKEYSPDELLEEPRAVVSACDGKAYLARDGNELLEVYSEIDALERSELGKIEFKSYHERYRWFLVPAAAVAFVAYLLKETIFRSIP
jgi:Ca-activated chloride channel family protein